MKINFILIYSLMVAYAVAELPSTALNVCTHHPLMNDIATEVALCKTYNQKALCEVNHCVWNNGWNLVGLN